MDNEPAHWIPQYCRITARLPILPQPKCYIKFKTRELLLKFCKQEHILLRDTPVQFSPDYHERIRISIENLPTELPDEDVLYFLSEYATPVEKTYYTVKRHNDKYYTTGTRVYQCIHLQQHIPRHVCEFGTYLRIRYNSQPTPASTTTSENNENTPLPDNQQTTSQTQENTTQPTLPQTLQLHKKNKTKTHYEMLHQYHNHTIHPTKHKNNNRNHSNKQRQYHNRMIHQTKHKDNNRN